MMWYVVFVVPSVFLLVILSDVHTKSSDVSKIDRDCEIEIVSCTTSASGVIFHDLIFHVTFQ